MRYGKISRNKQNLYIAFVDFMSMISIKGVEKGPYHLSIHKLGKYVYFVIETGNNLCSFRFIAEINK